MLSELPTLTSFRYRSDLAGKSAFVHDAALPCDSACILPPPSCASEAVKQDVGGSSGSALEQVRNDHEAAEPAVRAASPFAAESLASASSAVSLSSSVSADELQVCSALT
jgi:hypothetical protein